MRYYTDKNKKIISDSFDYAVSKLGSEEDVRDYTGSWLDAAEMWIAYGPEFYTDMAEQVGLNYKAFDDPDEFMDAVKACLNIRGQVACSNGGKESSIINAFKCGSLPDVKVGDIVKLEKVWTGTGAVPAGGKDDWTWTIEDIREADEYIDVNIEWCVVGCPEREEDEELARWAMQWEVEITGIRTL